MSKTLDGSSPVVSMKRKKALTIHDLTPIKPLTDAQADMIESYCQGRSILALGSAGTGKTLIAVYMGLLDLLNKDVSIDNIKIVRSIVPSREVGFLPGDLEEKIEVYETPYKELFNFIFKKPTSYQRFKQLGQVEFIPTSYLRGQTWDNSVIIVDEVQNMTIHEINTIMTRVGVDSKVIIIGDSRQTDLYRNSRDVSGLKIMEEALKDHPQFDMIYFTPHDIVRSEFVKSWILALENVVELEKL